MDTTDRHQVEQRLRRAERMEAVGQLTGGVAHDFNNLLMVIVGNAESIDRRAENPVRVCRGAEAILLAARRGSEITDKLLTFSRQQITRPEIVNLNKVLNEFQPLLERGASKAVTLVLDLDPHLDPVRLDPGQFEAAVLNLVVNARDALPAGGTVTIRSRNVTLGVADVAAAPELDPGSYVLVAVTDDGIGMDEGTAAKAFEPFFTTKEVGKGTGLGLSQVYGTVRQAGGHARIVSAPGQGTTVEMLLPRLQDRIARDRPGHDIVPLRRATPGEVVLVVEDEPSVMELAVECLQELGYHTLTAFNAVLALERLKGAERIDALFSDVVMPGGMNGVQLAVQARRLRPGLKVLLTSGYSASAEAGDVPEDVPLLPKPYDRGQLATRLRLVIGQ